MLLDQHQLFQPHLVVVKFFQIVCPLCASHALLKDHGKIVRINRLQKVVHRPITECRMDVFVIIKSADHYDLPIILKTVKPFHQSDSGAPWHLYIGKYNINRIHTYFFKCLDPIPAFKDSRKTALGILFYKFPYNRTDRIVVINY